MRRYKQTTSDETFYAKYGVDPNATGPLPPEIKCRIARCAVLRRFGKMFVGHDWKFGAELVDELIGDACVECLATELDETVPFRGQASYLYGSAHRAARRTLRKLGLFGGHAPKTVNDVEIGDAYICATSYVANKAPDPYSDEAVRRYEDEDESDAIRSQIERLKLLPGERETLPLLLEGLTFSEVAARLGVTRMCISHRAARIGEKLQEAAPEWLKEKIETIRRAEKKRLARIEASKRKGERR